MSRATMSTGNITFNTEDQLSNLNNSANESCHIVLMANFSGRESSHVTPIANRKLISVDRDNFDEVFSSLNVECQLPLSAEALSFKTLDDMHPDYLYEHLPLFDHLKKLKRQLKSANNFAKAAAEIYQWHTSQEVGDNESQAQQQSQSDSDSEKKELSLDDLLSEQKQSFSADQFNIAGLIKSVVAPYVQPKPDPQQKELLKTVDDATSELMRKLMHHKKFQSLESSWRSLYRLTKRIETNRKLKLFIVDIGQQELIKDALLSESLSDSQTYQLLVSKRESIGSIPPSLILHDAEYGQNPLDINSLNNLSEIASACGAALVVGGSEQLAGCQGLQQAPYTQDWNYQRSPEVTEAWNLFRGSPHANNVVVVTPRYLDRMPYGKRSNPIDSFNFEELTEQHRHQFYLWSNGAWLVTLIAAQSYTESGSLFSGKVQQIDGLPLHVYQEEGESIVTPCAEIHMTDSTSHALRSVGLTSIRSILNKDSVIIPNIKPVTMTS